MTRTKLEGLAQIRKLRNALEQFRKIDAEMPLQQIMLMLGAAEAEMRPGNTEPASVQELCMKLDLAQSTASRNLAVLTGKDQRKMFDKDGKPKDRVALLDAFENPMNRRTKLVTLTSDGAKLVRSLVSAME